MPQPLPLPARSRASGPSRLPHRMRIQLRESQLLGALGLLGLFLQAVVIGLASGLVIGIFRIAYTELNSISVSRFSGWLSQGWSGFFCIAGAMVLLCGFSCLLVRMEPMIAGSGIPQVELAQAGRYPPMVWHRVLASKFLATLISLTAGLSVGRQGPSIQMGAAVGIGVGTLLHGTKAQSMHRYLSAGAVSGMTAAFSSPLTGVLFAIEDMRIVFDWRMLAFLGTASATAWLTVTHVLGLPLVFPFLQTDSLQPFQWWLVIPLAVLAGLMGAGYCKSMLAAISWEDSLNWHGNWARLAIPFAAACFLMYAYPNVIVGFGPSVETLEQAGLPFASLLLLLVIKVAFSCLCFASGIAGGILIPILSIGALAGSCASLILESLGVLAPTQCGTVLLLVMASFFTGVVRSPLSAATLMVETTGAWGCTPLLLIAVFIANFAARLTGTPPIYSQLQNRFETMVKAWSTQRTPHP